MDKKYYIKLTGLPRPTDDVEDFWIISYNKNQDLFICENNSNSKITKMKNVENFIKVWSHDVHQAIRILHVKDWSSPCTHKAYIKLFIENNYFSGYTITKNASVIGELIQKYVFLLKDIIDEDDKDDEKATEKLNTVQ